MKYKQHGNPVTNDKPTPETPEDRLERIARELYPKYYPHDDYEGMAGLTNMDVVKETIRRYEERGLWKELAEAQNRFAQGYGESLNRYDALNTSQAECRELREDSKNLKSLIAALKARRQIFATGGVYDDHLEYLKLYRIISPEFEALLRQGEKGGEK